MEVIDRSLQTYRMSIHSSWLTCFVAIAYIFSSCFAGNIYNTNDQLNAPLSYGDRISSANGRFISRRRKWAENDRVAFLCPKNSFIYKLQFYFGTSWTPTTAWESFDLSAKPVTNDPTKIVVDLMDTLQQSNISSGEASKIGIAKSTCRTFLHCLGHQACLFKVNTEFCGYRQKSERKNHKRLDVVYYCIFDYLNFSKFTHKKSQPAPRDSALYMWHPPTEGPIRNQTIVNKYYIPEEELFAIDCPPPEVAWTYGFVGHCTKKPPPQPQIAMEMWNKLGRAVKKECRKELLDAYCAIKYNASGGCIPPALVLQPKDGSRILPGQKWSYSFKSLPYVGNRPSMEEHNQLTTNVNLQLIPPRLAFAILVHQSDDAVIHLLHTIYRTAHYYAIHVDKREDTLRENVKAKIAKEFKMADNIRVLPKERSFTASWGSYEIVRAELECFEELMRMGPWDIALDLSGADLPIRDIDDIAATLASVRGHIFFRGNINARWHGWKINQPKFKTVWYSCDCHVYNVSSRQFPDYIDMYSASQWGIFSREAIELVLSPNREGLLQQIQFFTQSSLIPDESYLKSTLMMSHLKGKVRSGNLHVFNDFAQRDPNGFCRHSEDIDFCGQGPMNFKDSDIKKLRLHSLYYMFARKFDGNVHSQLRKDLASWRSSDFRNMLVGKHVNTGFLNQLIHVAMKRRFGDMWYQGTEAVRIKKWRMLPIIEPVDPCCAAVYTSTNRILHAQRYWIDFEINTKSGKTVAYRASFRPKQNVQCFCKGHLKMLQLMGDYSYKSSSAAVPYIPYDPIVSKYLHIKGVFKMKEPFIEGCNEMQNMKRIYPRARDENKPYQFADVVNSKPENRTRSLWWGSSRKTLTFHAYIFDPYGKVKCQKMLKMTWSLRRENGPEDAQYLLGHIDCRVLYTGMWTLVMYQEGVKDPFPYATQLYLVDKNGNTDNSRDQLYNLWAVEGMMEIPVNAGFYDLYTQNTAIESNHTTIDRINPKMILKTQPTHSKPTNQAKNDENENHVSLPTTSDEEKQNEYNDANDNDVAQQPVVPLPTQGPVQPMGQEVIDGMRHDGNLHQTEYPPLVFTTPILKQNLLDILDLDLTSSHPSVTENIVGVDGELRTLQLDPEIVLKFDKDIQEHKLQRRFLVAGSQVEKVEKNPDLDQLKLKTQMTINPKPSEPSEFSGILSISWTVLVVAGLIAVLTRGVLVPLRIVKVERRYFRVLFLLCIGVVALQSVYYIILKPSIVYQL